MIESKFLSLYIAIGVIALLTMYLCKLIFHGKHSFQVYDLLMHAFLLPFWPSFIVIWAYAFLDEWIKNELYEGSDKWIIKILTKKIRL